MSKKRYGTFDAKSFILKVKKNNVEFNNEDHHDAHEFLIWLFDSIQENIKSETKNLVSNSSDSV